MEAPRLSVRALGWISLGLGAALIAAIWGRRSSRRSRAVHATAAITVKRPVEEVYRYWHDLENLPTFMSHLQSVRTTDGRRSVWQANAPVGRTVQWAAEIVEDTPNERMSWRSLPGADVPNRGSVRFAVAPGGRGTEVVVDLEYSPPAGRLGAVVAKLLGEEPSQQVRDDLRRFKQVLETGEVVRSEGSPHGGSTRALLRQRPAQPVADTGEGATAR